MVSSRNTKPAYVPSRTVPGTSEIRLDGYWASAEMLLQDCRKFVGADTVGTSRTQPMFSVRRPVTVENLTVNKAIRVFTVPWHDSPGGVRTAKTVAIILLMAGVPLVFPGRGVALEGKWECLAHRAPEDSKESGNVSTTASALDNPLNQNVNPGHCGG